MTKNIQTAKAGPSVGIGFLAAFIAWSCCISAIVLGFLGLATAAAFMANIQMMYHWWLVGLAFVSMDAAIYYMLKHYNGTCDYRVIRHNSGPIVLVILAALLMYFLLQAILPSLVELAHIGM
jgi:hypothetical protein